MNQDQERISRQYGKIVTRLKSEADKGNMHYAVSRSAGLLGATIEWLCLGYIRVELRRNGATHAYLSWAHDKAACGNRDIHADAFHIRNSLCSELRDRALAAPVVRKQCSVLAQRTANAVAQEASHFSHRGVLRDGTRHYLLLRNVSILEAADDSREVDISWTTPEWAAHLFYLYATNGPTYFKEDEERLPLGFE